MSDAVTIASHADKRRVYIKPDFIVFGQKKCDMTHIWVIYLSLYCDSMNRVNYSMDALQDSDAPLSQSSVSINLSLIQKRCSQLMNDTDGLELTLEEPAVEVKSNDPYNQR